MGKLIDLTGQQFGEWEVLSYLENGHWICKCSCGTEKSKKGTELRSGESKSCGHNRNGFIDLTRKQIGEWTIIKYLGDKYWECKCSCGKVKRVHGNTLRNGESVSCGHGNTGLIDELGKTFGEWAVIKYAEHGNWLCRCSCGTEKEISGRQLRAGETKSCGHGNNKFKDLTNKQFGYWTALEYVGNFMWRCKCSCGNIDLVHRYDLLTEKSKSCGCMTQELSRSTLLYRYGEVAGIKIGKGVRELWQIQVVENRKTFNDYLSKFSGQKTISEIAQLLGLTHSAILQKIHGYKLEHYIEFYPEHSKEEDQVYEYLKSINPNIEIVRSNRDIIKPYELDMYAQSDTLAVEVNGAYYHSDLFKDKDYHQTKTLDCAKKGIRLIHIFDYEIIDEVKFNIIKNLLRSIICKDNTIIYGRGTKVEYIDSKTSEEFLTEYHLQGNAKSSVKLGCYRGEELIGVMTFGTPRFNSTSQYELIRLAWKSGVSVVGGADKLFKFFIRNVNPTSIVTYCDIAKFTGNVYTRLGFKTKAEYITKPGYCWVNKKLNVLNRYDTQKSKLTAYNIGASDQTEDEIMRSIGYFKVYNSGNLKLYWGDNKD